MNNYLSKSYLFILLLNHVQLFNRITLFIFLIHIFHSLITSLGVKFNLGTALQFKFQVSLKSGDISGPRLIKNQLINIFLDFKKNL